MSARKQQPRHHPDHHHWAGQDQEEQLVRAWEGLIEQAAASLLGARLKVGGFNLSSVDHSQWRESGVVG